MSAIDEIDAIGLLCPLPVLRLRKRLKGVVSGTEVTVLADDPVAVIDIPHYCAEAGHEYLGAEPFGDASDGKMPQKYRLRVG